MQRGDKQHGCTEWWRVYWDFLGLNCIGAWLIYLTIRDKEHTTQSCRVNFISFRLNSCRNYPMRILIGEKSSQLTIRYDHWGTMDYNQHGIQVDTTPKFNSSPLKMIVGRLLSFWNGKCSLAMLKFQVDTLYWTTQGARNHLIEGFWCNPK